MQDQIRLVVVRSGVPVDQHQALAPVVADHAGGGPDRQRGAGHDEHIGLGDSPGGPVHHVLVQALLVEHHVGLDHAAAVAEGHAPAVLDVLGAVALVATGAVVPQDGAVELQNVLAAGLLVEAVDVLGDPPSGPGPCG